jgi:hypothetical protein
VRRALLHPVFLRACLAGAVFLVLLWAFLSYLQPAFSGERVAELWRCN